MENSGDPARELLWKWSGGAICGATEVIRQYTLRLIMYVHLCFPLPHRHCLRIHMQLDRVKHHLSASDNKQRYVYCSRGHG